jgi:hypothetical protein
VNGLALAYEYWKQYGKPMLDLGFASYADRVACGLVGEGSERFGYDDDLSADHDYGAGFCMWLTDDDFQCVGSALQRAYDELPKEFLGYPVVGVSENGERRAGVIRISDFYRKYTGLDAPPSSMDEWRRIPETFLATATNGQVWSDRLGMFTRWREVLLAFYPEDVFRRKLAARVATMAQAGQYNYPRSLQRRDSVAACLALSEFIGAACSAVYLLNRRYMPFYKWAHRGMRDLPKLGAIYVLIAKAVGVEDAREYIENMGAVFADCFRERGLSTSSSEWLLDHALEIAGGISDTRLRNLPIFAD